MHDDRQRHRHEGHDRHGHGRGYHGHHEHHGHHDHHDPHEHPRHRGGHGAGHGGPRGRARRGEARYILLDVLKEEAKHGYDVIKTLEERSNGQYVPSPGTVYPTLQMLEDQGLVRAEQGEERRTYQLTEAGKAELNAHAEEINAFWARFMQPTASTAVQTELNFVQDELEELAKTVRGGLNAVQVRDDPETIRRVRTILEQCKNEVRRLIAGNTDEMSR